METVKPTALWVTPVSNLAGVARHIIDVAKVGLPGWRLVVTGPEGPLLDELRAVGCAVIPLPIEQTSTATSAQALRRTIRRLRPAIVHSHLAKADILATIATAGLPTKLVSTEHHIPPDRFMFHSTLPAAVAMETVHHLRLRRFAQVIAVSASTKRDMLKYWQTKTPITVILNAVDRPNPRPVRTPGLRLLSLTRLDREKNVAATLRAFALLSLDQPSARLTVGGTGPELASLQQLAVDLAIAERVSFPGFVNTAEAMANHDVIVQPSKSDNCSYTLLDAVANGLGVAASPIGGNPEILPAHCIADFDDDAALARIAVEQGLQLDRRPTLPEAVPTLAQMAERIVRVYQAVQDGSVEVPTSLQPAATEPASPVEASVVIAYWRNAATIGEQLDGLAAQQDAPRFEVVIADNEGSTELPALIERWRDQLEIRIVPADEARGQCHARNQGALAARSRYLALCDADDIVGPGWLAGLVAELQAADCLATGPLRLDRINPEYAWRTYLEVTDDAPVESPVLQLPFTSLGYERFVVGCNLGVRRDSYLRLGGMDPTILSGSEDVDFSWRAQEAGLALRVADAAVVDYRLRTDPAAVARQRRGYQRSLLRVWARSQAMGRPVREMSLRWAITQTARLPLGWLRQRTHPLADRYRYAAWAGSVLGNLQGQLGERVLPRLKRSGR